MVETRLLITGSGRASADAQGALVRRGYTAVHVADLDFCLERIAPERCHLVVVGDESSAARLRFCVEARRRCGDVPILLLGARAPELERIGHPQGPDDYVVREFDEAEVLARVRALLRRSEGREQAGVPALLECGPLRLDPSERSVTYEGRRVELTSIEFQLLSHLARGRGRPIPRNDLLRAVWGYDHDGYSHTLTTHVNRVRTKLEQELGAPRLIETVRGIGYCIGRRHETTHPASTWSASDGRQ